MKRVFGKKKEKGPAPSLSEAGGRVDERVTKIDEKVRHGPIFVIWLLFSACLFPSG